MKSNRVLSILEGFVGVTALGGGIGLAAAPGGGILHMDRALLAGSPFSDYLIPGLLLAVFVGAGGVLASVLAWRRGPYWQSPGLVYALGLIFFEVVELKMIGFNVLQPFEAVLGLAMLGLVMYSPRLPRAATLTR